MFAVERAQVGSAALRQHEVHELELDRAWVIAMALGPPRLWADLLAHTLTGFMEGYGRPHDGRASTQLHQGLRAAQASLRARVEALIERRLPDVGLLALALEGSVLHVLGAGPLRAYGAHGKTLRRLGSREDSSDGLLRGATHWSAEPLEADELVFAASLSASAEPSLRVLQQALAADRATSPERVVELLNGPAAELGIGAVTLAFRAPSSSG